MRTAEYHLLLVEDDPSYAALVCDELAHSEGPFQITRVDCLHDAVERLQKGGIDAVLLDLSLPDSEGLDTLNRLRAAAPEIPVVVVSGRQDRELAMAAVQSGAHDYLVKSEIKAPVVHRVVHYAIERHGAEDRLREREARYRSIIESSLDAIISIDSAGHILEFNAAAVAMFERSRADAIGRELAALIIPERLRPAHRRALARHTANPDRPTPRQRLEFMALRSNGVEFPVELTISKTPSPAGSVFTGFIRDLTERQRAEDSRREAQTRIAEQASLLDQARDAILVRDLDHRLTYYNKSAERLYGWSAADIIGQSVRDRFFPEPAVFDEAMWHLLDHGDWQGEVRVKGRDDAELIVESRWTLTRDAAGRPRAVLVIDTDITERKELERRFLRAQRLESIGTLAGGIAHDLNNMLAPVLMSIELLKGDLTESERDEILTTVEGSARRGASMVRQVLTFARGVEGERTAVDIALLIKGVEKFANDTFMKNLTVRTEIAPRLGAVLGDVTQLQQVLVNLCLNARDAMPQGGTLTLSAEQRTINTREANRDLSGAGAYVRIRVADTGAGIPPRILDRIFEPFFTSKPTGKGTGLGLSTSQAIVKSHGGFIRVETQLGQGSEFTVYLPAQTGPVLTETTVAATEIRRGAGELVLVVDDEEPLLRMTSLVLEAFGYRVLLAANGAEAVALFTQHRDSIKVVITDMTMPAMDGAAVIRAIRELDPKARIIAASGLGPQAAQVDGVMRFLPKPLTADALLKAVSDVVRSPVTPPMHL